jgi:hypothetical protein
LPILARSVRKDVKPVAHLQRFSTVILSAADTPQSEEFAESKDPYPFSIAAGCQDIEAVPEMEQRKNILQARYTIRGILYLL